MSEGEELDFGVTPVCGLQQFDNCVTEREAFTRNQRKQAAAGTESTVSHLGVQCAKDLRNGYRVLPLDRIDVRIRQRLVGHEYDWSAGLVNVAMTLLRSL